MQRADAVARSRAGDVTFAVIDTRGHIHGKRYTTPVRGVSTIKSLLLLTFLRQPSVRHRSLTSAEKSLLDRMIRYSDNGAASTMIGRLGERQIEAEARRIGMRSFQLIHGFWGLSPTSARDQAVLFRHLDQNLPKRHRTYARRLFSIDRLLPAVGRSAGRAARVSRAVQGRLGLRHRQGDAPGRAAGARRHDARSRHHDVRQLRHGVRRDHDRAVTKALLRPQPCAS